MDPENGRFDFWLFDRFVETAETSGMKLYAIVNTHLYPDWVEPYLQGGFGRFLEEAEEFAETVVKHVTERYPQVIFAWQVENEPWEVGPAASRTHLLSTREKVLYLSGVADAVRRVDQRNPTVLTTNMKWSTVLSGLTAEEDPCF